MPSISQYVQAIVDGLMIGSMYALVALSLSVLWASIRTVNMALLQVPAVAGMVAWRLSEWGSIPALVGGALAATAVGVLTHLVAVRPLLKKWALLPIIASLGAGLLVQGGVIFFAGNESRRMPSLVPTGTIEINGIFMRRAGLVVLGVAFVFVLGTIYLTRRTRVGLAFRASSWSSEIASAYGISIEKVRMGSTVAASFSMGLVGVLSGVLAGSVSPFMGETSGLKGLVAMLLGGAGNLVGALVAGLLIGVLESASGLFVSSAMKNVISFGLLFVVMVLRPSGLFKEQ